MLEQRNYMQKMCIRDSGDTIQVAGEEVEITCALSQGLFGDDLIIICSQETFDPVSYTHLDVYKR